jgi:hypothetical protein
MRPTVVWNGWRFWPRAQRKVLPSVVGECSGKRGPNGPSAGGGGPELAGMR